MIGNGVNFLVQRVHGRVCSHFLDDGAVPNIFLEMMDFYSKALEV
jgi:hypothetical protein